MKTSPKIQSSPTLGGKSIPMNPEMQIDLPAVVIWSHSSSWNNNQKEYIHHVIMRLQRVGLTSDDEGDVWHRWQLVALHHVLNRVCVWEKWTVILKSTSPFMSGSAPMNFWICSTWAFGPAMREVPVSAMAWHPFGQPIEELPPRTCNSRFTYWYV